MVDILLAIGGIAFFGIVYVYVLITKYHLHWLGPWKKIHRLR